MHWFDDYKEELAHVFDDAHLIVSRFPDPLGQLGQTYMDAFNPLLESSTKNYVCYLLPYWLENALPLRREHTRELSLANVFGMLHYFILDDLMDEPSSPRGRTEQLALSELFLMQYLSLYRKLFPHDSPFWQYHDNYAAEWSDTVCNERNENYFLSDPLRIAKKAGPVKLASTGALLLCNRMQLLYPVSEMVDLLLVTLQMNDDWADWEEDLASGNYNGLIALIKSMEGLACQDTITSDQVRTALYMSDAMSRYSARAIAAHQRLKTLDFVAPKLLDFHLFLVDQLAQVSVRFEEERRSLELGALNHWIYKNLK